MTAMPLDAGSTTWKRPRVRAEPFVLSAGTSE